MQLITISDASGWWVLIRLDDDRWRREPLACWALIEDGGAPFVVGQVVAPDGETVELAEPGRYVHGEQFPRCECRKPATELMDVTWCTFCGSVVA